MGGGHRQDQKGRKEGRNSLFNPPSSSLLSSWKYFVKVTQRARLLRVSWLVSSSKSSVRGRARAHLSPCTYIIYTCIYREVESEQKDAAGAAAWLSKLEIVRTLLVKKALEACTFQRDDEEESSERSRPSTPPTLLLLLLLLLLFAHPSLLLHPFSPNTIGPSARPTEPLSTRYFYYFSLCWMFSFYLYNLVLFLFFVMD